MDKWTAVEEELNERAWVASDLKRRDQMAARRQRANDARLAAASKPKVAARGTPNVSASALREWMESPNKTLHLELRNNARYAAFRNELSPHIGPSGGFLGTMDLNDSIERAMMDNSPLRRFARVLRRPPTVELRLPYTDDTGNTGARIDANEQRGQADFEFGQKVLAPGNGSYTSGIAKVPFELEDDSEILLDALGTLLGERIARSENADFVNGSTAGYAQGFLHVAAVGVTAASASAVTIDELLGLAYSVNSVYRARSAWMMNSDTALAVKQLKDGSGRFLFDASGCSEWPIVENDQMPDFGASAKPIAFGDWSKFTIRDSTVARLVRIQEAEGYADKGATGYVLNMHIDGALMTAGNPVKTLQMGAGV